MEHSFLAAELFLQGYNCAQAVVGAFCEDYGYDMQTATKLVSGFGGGMGRLREVCGAVSGMFMVAGLLYGNENKKADHYKLIQDLANEFKEENGSIICRELIGVKGPEAPTPEKRTEKYYLKRPCAELVEMAADIIDKYIKERENVQ